MIPGGFSTEAEREAFGMTAAGYCRLLLDRGVERGDILERLVESKKSKNLNSAAVIFSYVNKPRNRGKAKHFVRTRPGDTGLYCPIAPDLMERLQTHADRRDVAPRVLAQMILATVLKDDMVNAVLDDGVEA